MNQLCRGSCAYVRVKVKLKQLCFMCIPTKDSRMSFLNYVATLKVDILHDQEFMGKKLLRKRSEAKDRWYAEDLTGN